MSRRVRWGLAGLIVFEIVGGAVVLWWVLGAPARPSREASQMRLFVAPDLPAELIVALQGWVAGQPGDWTWLEPTSGLPPAADVVLSWQKPAGGAQVMAQVVLVPVAAFPAGREQVSLDALRLAWQERHDPGSRVTQMLVSPVAARALEAILGPPGAGAAVEEVAAGDLVGRLWADRSAVGVVPFDRLEPRLKVLAVDGLSVLDRELNLQRYPLVAEVWGRGPRAAVRALSAWMEERGLNASWHPERLTVLVMTGVTALTRGVAVEMEARGDYGWPARRIEDLMTAADLTHVSNEVSFRPDCVAQVETPAFCAKPEYMETLRRMGVDVVELTGNHNLDFGPEPALLSLNLYDEVGMRTFGGGRNAAEARQALIVEHNGSRLAFLGYNQFGPDYAWAGENSPGAARFSLDAVRNDVAAARSRADLVLVSIQYTETYSPTPLPLQVDDFRATIEAGADVVLGSQAHQPQAVAFYEGGLILYGLGNLIFDQTWSTETRESLIVRHTVYGGRLVATELIPTVMDDDMQPRVVEGAEREGMLRAVFEASGWEGGSD